MMAVGGARRRLLITVDGGTTCLNSWREKSKKKKPQRIKQAG